jgi:hypothetical protein
LRRCCEGDAFADARSTDAACAHSYAKLRSCSRRLDSPVRPAASAQSLAWCSYNLISADINSLLINARRSHQPGASSGIASRRRVLCNNPSSPEGFRAASRPA